MPRTKESGIPSLEELLERGEVKSALLLKGEFTDSEREMIRRAWEFGLEQGKAERDALREAISVYVVTVHNAEDHPDALASCRRPPCAVFREVLERHPWLKAAEER